MPSGEGVLQWVQLQMSLDGVAVSVAGAELKQPVLKLLVSSTNVFGLHIENGVPGGST